MKGRIDNKMGSIQIDPEVIAMYAGTTAVECFGIVGMAAVSMKDGLVRLLKKESLTHGINVAIKDNALSIDFHVIVAYGVSISTVADNLIESVKYKVEEFTGMTVDKINIFVEGVRVIDQGGYLLWQQKRSMQSCSQKCFWRERQIWRQKKNSSMN